MKKNIKLTRKYCFPFSKILFSISFLKENIQFFQLNPKPENKTSHTNMLLMGTLVKMGSLHLSIDEWFVLRVCLVVCCLRWKIACHGGIM